MDASWIARVCSGLTLVLALSGCGPALQPFYTSSDLYEDPALEGTWTGNEGEIWRVERVGDGTYVIAESGDPNPVTAKLFRLGGALYLDFQEPRTGDKFTSAIRPHGLLRVRLAADEVEISRLDDDALRKALDARSVMSLPSLMLDHERFVVTASTARLREFLLKHGGDPQIWTDALLCKRQKL